MYPHVNDLLIYYTRTSQKMKCNAYFYAWKAYAIPQGYAIVATGAQK